MQPSKEEYARLKWLITRLGKSEDYCRPYFDRAKRHYKLYRFSTAVSDADWPYVNRVRSRDIFAFVEDTTAIMVSTLFATSPFISVIPRETGNSFIKVLPIDIIKIARQVERVLDYQLSHEDTDFFEEIIDYIKEGGIQGNSYLGVYPKFDASGVYTLPLLKNHGFWDVLPVPGSKRLSRSRGVYIREFLSMDDLEDQKKLGVFSNIERVTDTSEDTNKWHKALLEECGVTNYADTEDVEVIHYMSGGHIITFANRKVILRDTTIPNADGTFTQPYPYAMPVVQYKYVALPGEFFGMGIPEILEVLAEDKNLVRSARRDNIDLCINKILLTKDGSDPNYDLMRFFPGAIWPDMMDKVDTFDIPDVTQSSYAEEEMIGKDMENALSLFGYARGMTPEHSEQPTTVMKLQQAALNRVDVNIKLAEYTVLQEIARKVVMLDRMYMKKEDYEAILGEPDAGFYMLPIEYINRCYTIKPVGSSVTNIKEIRQQQIQFALQTLMGMPPQLMQANIKPFTVDYYELMKEALDVADIKTIDRILVQLNQQQQGGDIMGMVSQIMGNPQVQQMIGGLGQK